MAAFAQAFPQRNLHTVLARYSEVYTHAQATRFWWSTKTIGYFMVFRLTFQPKPLAEHMDSMMPRQMRDQVNILVCLCRNIITKRPKRWRSWLLFYVQLWMLKRRLLVELHTYIYLNIPRPPGVDISSDYCQNGALQVFACMYTCILNRIDRCSKHNPTYMRYML